jgi:hypothetical protein
MNNQKPSGPFASDDAAHDAEENMQQVQKALVEIGNIHDTLNKLPAGKTAVAFSIRITDLVSQQLAFARDLGPALSDGTPPGSEQADMDEATRLCSLLFIEILAMGNNLTDAMNKRIETSITITNGETKLPFTTSFETGANMQATPKVTMTGPNGPLSDDQVKKAEEAFGNMFSI